MTGRSVFHFHAADDGGDAATVIDLLSGEQHHHTEEEQEEIIGTHDPSIEVLDLYVNRSLWKSSVENKTPDPKARRSCEGLSLTGHLQFPGWVQLSSHRQNIAVGSYCFTLLLRIRS